MSDPAITPDLIKQHGLTPEEFERIRGILGRAPNYTELGIFSVMWSEHCSYKNSRPLLKTFPTKSPKILVGAGDIIRDIFTMGARPICAVNSLRFGPITDDLPLREDASKLAIAVPKPQI